MKVTFCTYDSPTFTGGPNSWLRRLLPGLREAGIEVEILFFIDHDSPVDCPCFVALDQQGFSCQSFFWQTSTQQQIRWILSKLSENPTDIFIPNAIVSALYASRWVKQVGIPTVGVLHSDDNFYQGLLQSFVWGQSSYQLSALVCVSDFLRDLVKQSGELSTQIIKIPCGVPIPTETAQEPLEKLRLIYIGRLVEEQKQVSKVTSALCRALREVPGTEAVIYGEGPARTSVQNLIATEGNNLPIHLGGLIDNNNIHTVMQQAHVLVLLSDYEGLPISLMEAMGCGLVPVCLKIRSGIPELVEDGVTGLLVDNRDDQFVQAIYRLKNEPNLWKCLAQSARSKIELSYSNETCVKAWKTLLLELHHQAQEKSSLAQPFWLQLPPVNPALVHHDRREHNILGKLKNKLYRQGSVIKKRMLQTF